MSEIEKENRKRSKKSKKAKEEAASSEGSDVAENQDQLLASQQLKALVEAAQVEWMMAEDRVQFTEEISENEAQAQKEDEARALAELGASEAGGEDASSEASTEVETSEAELSENEASFESALEGVNFEESAESEHTELEPESFEAMEASGRQEDPDALEASEENISSEEALQDENPLEETIEKEASEEAVEFIEAEQAVSIIESMLFSSDKPVSVGTLKQVFKGTNIKTKDITRALESLASDYASLKRGVSLEEINGGYQLRTKSDNAEYLRRLSKTRPFKLSGPALEVLSIVAYKQPCIKAELDEIRGVESGHLLRALMERGLVAFAGKSELPGKPMLYQTTRKFLEIFGLRNLRELPTLSEIDELIPEGIGEEPEKKETLSDLTGVLSKEVTNTYSEGEEDLLKISDQLQQINTSSDFFEQEKVRQREKRDFERAQNIREALEVGEAVESKDQKWLARYEAKLAEASLQAQATALGEEGTLTTSSAEGLSPEAEMEALATVEEAVEEALFESSESDESQMTEESQEMDSSEDLSAMPDWDEEK